LSQLLREDQPRFLKTIRNLMHEYNNAVWQKLRQLIPVSKPLPKERAHKAHMASGACLRSPGFSQPVQHSNFTYCWNVSNNE
jgi:hypothetical protein